MPKIIAVGFFIFVQGIIYLANTGYESMIFDYFKSLPYGDKFTHFFLFGLLTLLFNIALKLESFPIGRFKIYFGTIAISCFVVFEELSQSFFPTRSVDINDMVADTVGIMFFTLVSYFTGKRYLMQNPRKAALIRRRHS